MKKREKVYAFLVDGSNLYASSKSLGFDVDFKKLIDAFEGSVLKAYYFTALPPDEEQSSLRPLVDFLDYNGWTVFQKEYKEYTESIACKCGHCGQNNVLERPKIKGNMDIEIATIALEVAPFVTDLVLFSGDGDFKFMVETVQRRYGTNVTVVSTIKSRPSFCADELRRQADAFVDLADLRGKIERDRSERRNFNVR